MLRQKSDWKTMSRHDLQSAKTSQVFLWRFKDIVSCMFLVTKITFVTATTCRQLIFVIFFNSNLTNIRYYLILRCANGWQSFGTTLSFFYLQPSQSIFSPLATSQLQKVEVNLLHTVLHMKTKIVQDFRNISNDWINWLSLKKALNKVRHNS